MLGMVFSVHRVSLFSTEPQIFKTKFIGWDDVIPVDYTRTSESVQRRGHDIKVIMERDRIQTDLSALFAPRQPAMSAAEAVSFRITPVNLFYVVFTDTHRHVYLE